MGRSDLVGKRELWMRRMQRFVRCQLTVAAFCDQERVSVAAFYQWRRKLQAKNESVAKPSAAPASLVTKPSAISNGFVPVKLLQPAVIEVRLGNGVTLILPAGDLDALRQTLNIVSRFPTDCGEGE